MPKNNKLDWLTKSTVKGKDSFSPSSVHLYTDLKLDLRQSTSTTADRHSIQSSIISRNKDLECIYDTNCIEHSLKTLFQTPRGSRVLVPTYGTDLYKYIGKAITDVTCTSIKATLEYDINTWEPRVEILSLNVTQSPDESQVNIELYVNIPEIKTAKLLKYLFDTNNGKIQELEKEE